MIRYQTTLSLTEKDHAEEAQALSLGFTKIELYRKGIQYVKLLASPLKAGVTGMVPAVLSPDQT